MRIVYAVQNQVRKCDGVDEVVLFASVERAVLDSFELIGRGDIFVTPACHVLEGLCKKPARTAAGVIHRLPNLRINSLDHDLDYLARGEELSTVVALLTHLEQKPLVYLR